MGKEVGASCWPQGRTDRLIVLTARLELRVVRLTSGDLSIFGHVCEELAAARAAGLEVVPGITAASVSAETNGQPLTSRGETDTFTINAGTRHPGDACPDRARLAHPGTSMPFYISV